MRQIAIGKSVRRSVFAIVRSCSNCDTPKVMSLDSIRPAMFRGKDILTYKCRKCGFLTTDTMN
jgi:hypothetical protein